MPNFVPPEGPADAKIAIVGEAPGKDEDNIRRPFVGPAGKLLDDLLRESGIRRHDCFLTNVIKFRPPNNDLKLLKQAGIDIKEQEKILYDELSTLSPNLIIAVGNQALKSLTGLSGIQKYRGSLLKSNIGINLIPIVHPSALLRSNESKNLFENNIPYYYKYVTILDLEKCKRIGQLRNYTIPKKQIEIIKTAHKLYQFLEEYRNETTPTLDIETINCIPICLGIAFNSYHAVSVPLFDLHSLDHTLGISRSDLAEIHQILSKYLSNPRIKFIGQNIKFDYEKLIAPLRFLSYTRNKIHADTMLMASIAYPEFPKSLAFLTSIFTNEPYYKDEGKEFHPKKDKIEVLLNYNGKDCTSTREVYDKLRVELETFGVKDFYFDYTNKLTDFYMELEEEGILVDENKREELTKFYGNEIVSSQEILNTLVGMPVNVNSPKKIKETLYGILELPNRNDSSEDTLVGLLGYIESETGRKDRKIDPFKCKKIINLILSLRGLKKSVSTYLKAEPDYDGYMRSSYRITGTETGRSSTSVLKPPVRPTQNGLAFQTITKSGIGKEIRSIFIPEPGFVFFEADLSQAEARIVGLLSNDQETLKLFDTTDIHKLTASWIFGVSIDLITSEQRFIGKVVRHASNYGMGKIRLMLSVNSDAKKYDIPISISATEADRILKAFHSRTPNIRGVFHKEIENALYINDRVLINPFGRRRQFFDRFDSSLLGEAFAYIPQSTVPDHLRMSILRMKDSLDESKFRFCKEDHDGFLAKCKEDYIGQAKSIVEKELNKPINFAKCTLSRGELIIPVEVKIGRKNYKELEKI